MPPKCFQKEKKRCLSVCCTAFVDKHSQYSKNVISLKRLQRPGNRRLKTDTIIILSIEEALLLYDTNVIRVKYTYE